MSVRTASVGLRAATRRRTPPPPALISFRAAATGTEAAAAEVTVPASVQAGDGLLVFHGQVNPNNDPADPAGWTRVFQQDVGTTGRVTCWKKVAAAGDAGAVVRATPSHTQYVMVALAYTGTSGTDPVLTFATAAETTAKTAHTLPTVDNTAPSAVLVSLLQDRGTSAAGTGPTMHTPPGGSTSRAGVFSPAGEAFRLGFSVADQGPLAAGTHGGGLYTSDWSTNIAVLASILLRPA